MIVYPSRHLFEALSPTLEEGEEELRFQHPVEGIFCNQLGILFYDESRYYMVHHGGTTTVRYIDAESGHQTKKALGTKARVVWECYHGREMTQSYAHFYHRNGNIMDFSYGNIVTAEELSPKERILVASKRRKFIQGSIKYLIQLEKRHEEGMGIEALHEALMLPDWLINSRRKLDGAPPKKERRPYSGSGKKSMVTIEQEEKVETLYLSGITIKQITAEMGWKSTSKVKRIIRIRALSRKNL